MPTLGGFAETQSFLRSRVSPGTEAADAISEERRRDLTRDLFNETYGENRGLPWYDVLDKTIGASAIDLVDTIYGNQLIPGTERGDVWENLVDSGDENSRELAQFHQRNQATVETISGLTGAVGAAYFTGAFLLPRAASALASNSAIQSSKLWQAGARANAAVRTRVQASQLETAQSGLAYSEYAKDALKFKGWEGLKLSGVVAAEEAAIGLSMNANQAIWADEMSENLAFAGLGFIGGAGLGYLSARAQMRKYANSDEVLKARRDSVDPQAITSVREWQPIEDTQAAIRSEGVRGKQSAMVTAQMLEARQATPEGSKTKNLFMTRESVATRSALQTYQRISGKGIKGVKGTSYTVGKRTAKFDFEVSGNAGNHVIETLGDDPLAVFGLDSTGIPVRRDDRSARIEIPEEAVEATPDLITTQARRDYSRLKGNREKLDEAAEKIKDPEDRKRYKAELKETRERVKKAIAAEETAQRQQTPLGRTLSMREAYIERLHSTGQTKHIREANRLAAQEPMVLVNKTWDAAETPDAKALSDFRPGRFKIKPSSKHEKKFEWQSETGARRTIDDNFRFSRPYDSFPINDRMEVNEAIDQMFKVLRRAGQAYTVPKDPTWTQLDLARLYERRGGSVDWSTEAGLRNADDALRESLAKKYDAIGDKPIGDVWTRQAYNLPSPNSRERIYDSHGDSIRTVLKAAKDGGTIEELSTLRSAINDMNGFGLREGEIKLEGNAFEFNRDSNGNWREIIIGYFDPMDTTKLMNVDTLAESLAEVKLEKIHHLMSGDRSVGMVPGLVDSLLHMPEYRPSKEVQALADDQVTGLGNTIRQGIGEFVTSEFRRRDNPATLSLFRVVENKNRHVNAQIEKLAKENLGDTVKQLSAAPNASSRALVNQFDTFRSGWDIDKTPVELDDGMVGFKLLKTDRNENRLGREVSDDNELLKSPVTGKPIVLDELGLRYVQGKTRIAHTILEDQNRIRIANGQTPIKPQPFYSPPIYTRDKHVGFVFDENGKIVPNSAVVAKTQFEFNKLRAKKDKELPEGQQFRSLQEIRESADLYDRAAIDWIDPGTIIGPSRAATGALTTDVINANSIQDFMDWVQRQAHQIGTGTLRQLYESELGIVRARGAIEKDMRGFKDNAITRTIWDEWENILMGRRFGATQQSVTGRFFKGPEEVFDGSLETIWPAISFMAPSQANAWIQDAMQRMGVKKFPGKARSFAELTEKLGPHSPYAKISDYMESHHRISPPPEVRRISEGLNQLTTANYLRWFELPHALMNMLGVITTMPSIVKSGRAPVTTHFRDIEGNSVQIIDSMRIMQQGMKDMYRPSRHADWDFMRANGDTNQSAAEYFQQMGSIRDRGTIRRILLGDKNARIPDDPGVRQVLAKTRQLGVDGLASIATDTTEKWSRQVSHFIGLRLADHHGIVGRDARHQFAREIANAAIANYSPLNKPEAYHSALGSMFGLFMSWMQSYNQRLFRWMEEEQYAAVAHQLGWQSALFGVTSNPAFDQLENVIQATGVGTTEEDRDATLTDHIYARFGPSIGSLVARGGVEQFPFSLYTRGDMNYRDLTMDPTRLAAGFGLADSVIKMVHEAGQTLFNEYSLEDSGRLQEIIARNMPNRVMKGLMTVAMNEGRDIDVRGQVIAETKSFYESAVRALGVRSSRQQAQIEAFYANKQQQDREAARQDVLRNETRSLLRTEGGAEKIGEVFTKYVKAGMRPEHFRTWLIDQLRAAHNTRGMNEVLRALRSGRNQQEIWRYEMYGGF